jgi:hypothetical protein
VCFPDSKKFGQISDTELLPKPKIGTESEPVRRIEVFTGAGRRRRWTPEQKALIVAETYESGETVGAVARRHGLRTQQLFTWLRNGQRVQADARRMTFAPVGYISAGCMSRPDRPGPSSCVSCHRDCDWGCHGSHYGRDPAGELAGRVARTDGGVMITVSSGVRVLIATNPVDFRKVKGMRRWCAECLARIPSWGRSSCFAADAPIGSKY